MRTLGIKKKVYKKRDGKANNNFGGRKGKVEGGREIYTVDEVRGKHWIRDTLQWVFIPVIRMVPSTVNDPIYIYKYICIYGMGWRGGGGMS